MSSNQDTAEEEKDIPIIYFDPKNPSIIINNPIAQEIFDNGYFGQWTNENSLKLEPEELLLLLDRGRIEIKDLEKKIRNLLP